MNSIDRRPKLALSKAQLYFCIYGLVALCTVNSYALQVAFGYPGIIAMLANITWTLFTISVCIDMWVPKKKGQNDEQ